MIWLRSLLFNMAFFGATGFIALVLLPLALGPRHWLTLPIRGWAAVVLWLLRVICGIHLRVTGAEHLPRGAGLIAAKHQSAFDTVVWLRLLPDPVYVLKKELLHIPLYGRLARNSGMIAVDRAGGASAMRHLLKAGRAAAEAGRQIVIFPEGTRVAPGVRVPYQPGVLALAAATGLPVVPVATDSGRYWGRRSFCKCPGTITVAVLPPLPTELRRDALMERLEAEIEAETARLLSGEAVDKPVDELGAGVRS
ncbi:1-acyl-sn-glycerol-3-phosphate acyltransferase [Siccirubricoccus deserti]|uniref:1-acyl-sn-glycerol-3-phosphate acyltransferase n=1 Tax=Siccirubricoccus deserti TaxID=2013562 RepID=A0A9X0QY53_9PROT|nr:lysophospholipid acyltransferase family protein [Siccirubricoccus deserti]MBC4015048.1 1-acyl-sn-glycerol-3-phosphate acyltransferase [Siccirubricoccus deserti]GGC36046.1 1-acyl-sn-glycerol-3-phosphate acyltransferase [Siccirubricoccus deserti]